MKLSQFTVRCALMALAGGVLVFATSCSDDDGGAGGATATSSSTGNTGGSGGATSGGTGGSGDCNAANHPIQLMASGDVVAPCGTYFQPINSPGNTVALFSEQPDIFGIKNTSDTAVSIDAITIVEADGVQDEEFSYQDVDGKFAEFAATTVEPTESFDFTSRFYPVASGSRKATLTIKYNGSNEYRITLEGEGSAGAEFAVDPSQVSTHLLGTSTSGADEHFGGLVADASGNMYLTGNSEESSDNLIVARVNADGTLGWAKWFDGPYNIKAIDSGQNGETGGTASSVAMGADGKLYVVAAASWTSSNNSFYTLVAKIEPSDGTLIWSKLWSSVATISIASESSVPYGIDASDADRIFVTGATKGESEVLALALDSSDGSVIFQKSIEVAATYNDRGYAVVYDGSNLYIGGQRSGNAGLLMKLSGADGSSPTVAWTKSVSLGTGSNINDLALDDTGNLYASYDIRGASTSLAMASFDASGVIRWQKVFQGNDGDKNNTHVVRVINDEVWVGGRTGPPNFDGQLGDGALLRLKTADGTAISTSFYFNGKGPDELTEHRVKGVALAGDKLLLGVQTYTGTSNYERFWGYWYKGDMVVDFATAPTTSSETGTMSDLSSGTIQDIDAQISNVDYEDVPSDFAFKAAQEKKDGAAPDAELMVISMPLP